MKKLYTCTLCLCARMCLCACSIRESSLSNFLQAVRSQNTHADKHSHKHSQRAKQVAPLATSIRKRRKHYQGVLKVRGATKPISQFAFIAQHLLFSWFLKEAHPAGHVLGSSTIHLTATAELSLDRQPGDGAMAHLEESEPDLSSSSEDDCNSDSWSWVNNNNNINNNNKLEVVTLKEINKYINKSNDT